MQSERLKTIVATVAVCIMIVEGLTFYLVYSKKKESYEKQLSMANATLEQIGELTDVYTVDENKKAKAGDEIEEKDLVTVKFPASCVQDNYILDPADAVGKHYKIDITYGTPLTQDTVMDEELDDSSREIDIVASSWPTGLKVGDYVDLRLIYPKGEDYIVLSHKRVNDINGETLKVVLSEREIMFYGAAVVDQFINSSSGAVLYCTKYVEPGVQKPAEVYYNIPANILTVLTANPNIIDKIVDTGISRDIIEREFNNISTETGSALGSGRTNYMSKLEQAKTYYSTKAQEESELDSSGEEAEDIPEDGIPEEDIVDEEANTEE